MWAIASTPTSCFNRAVSSMVFSAGLPPVLVTDTKLGPRSFKRSTVAMSFCSPSSLLGGKNSKEKTGRSR